MHNIITWQAKDLLLSIQVQTKASTNEILPIKNGILKVRLTAPPIDNAANTYLLKFMAKKFGVTQAQITIIKGLRSKKKILKIINPKQLPPQLNES